MPGKPWANHPYPSSFTSSRAPVAATRPGMSTPSMAPTTRGQGLHQPVAAGADIETPDTPRLRQGAPRARKRSRPTQRTVGDPYGWPQRVIGTASCRALGVDWGVDRCPRRSQGHVCVHSMPHESSLLVKRVLRLNVLLIIRWFRVHPLAPHLEFPVPGRDQVPAIVARIEGRLGRAPQPLHSYGSFLLLMTISVPHPRTI